MKLPLPGFPLQGHQSVVQTVFLHPFLMRTVLFHNAHPAVIDLSPSHPPFPLSSRLIRSHPNNIFHLL